MSERKPTHYRRFTTGQIVQHWILTVSFALLAITGLPQRYPLSFWADALIGVLGGIEAARIIHRIAAAVLAVAFFYHLVDVAYSIFVLRVRPSMLPGLRDAKDLLHIFRYNLGLTRERPKLPRYNVVEKLEYWALIWGSVVMGLTGFLLWNPIAAARLLPGEIIPASLAAHSAEALLAVAAIFIWHVYSVHIKTLNLAMFNGKLSREQMESEHAAELAEIESGVKPPEVPADVKRKRQRIFFPIAATGGLVVAVALFFFLTFEHTAIATVPPAEMAEVYVPITPTPVPPPAATPIPRPAGGEPVTGLAPIINHSLDGRADCLLCHTATSPVSFPASHAAFPVTACQVCHSTEREGEPPTPISHPLEGHEECRTCHWLTALPASHQMAVFTSADCLLCHTTGNGN